MKTRNEEDVFPAFAAEIVNRPELMPTEGKTGGGIVDLPGQRILSLENDKALAAVELILNPGPALIEAVCQVIRAAGFGELAHQYIEEPDKRERIALSIEKYLDRSREHGRTVALRFRKLELRAREMAGGSGSVKDMSLGEYLKSLKIRPGRSSNQRFQNAVKMWERLTGKRAPRPAWDHSEEESE
jgi:hypothetical protein